MFLKTLDNFILCFLLSCYMATGLTGEEVHQGSWLGLPDFGITEALQGKLTTSPSPTGLTTNTGAPANVTVNPTGSVDYNQAIGSGGLGQVLPASTETPPPSQTNNNQSTGQTPQQKWEALGRTGQAPVGWNGEASGTSGIDESAINNVYQPTMNYLNQAESAVRADFPNVLDAAQKQYESAIAELQGNRQKNLTTINENKLTATNQKEDALSAARRLYSELRRGYQQRFGGSTSAGQAAYELSNVEQQRQMGQTTRDYATTMRQIEQQKAQLETDYQTGSLKIQESKAMAIAQANRDFQNQLLSIANQRAQTEGAKAAAKLDALNTLRNQAYAAQQEALTYQRNLDAMYKQQQLDMQSYVAKLNAAGSNSQTALNNFQTPTPTSNLQVNDTNAGATVSPTGQTTTGTWKWDATQGRYVQA